ncbi:hypothetical protein H1R20_g1272, partial [Candolleomyces eurysporus]
MDNYEVWFRYLVGKQISEACKASLILFNLLPFIAITSANASLWLCLHALLGAKRKYLMALIVIFAGFAISCLVLMLFELNSWTAVRPMDFVQNLGYTCAYSGTSVKAHAAVATVAYIRLAWAALSALMGIITLLGRYRKQNDSLINIIRRDGGIYYLTVITITLADTVTKTPTNFKKTHGVIGM